MPLSHVTGLIANVAAMARCAGALVILPAFKAREFLAVAERERMTHTLMVPAMYNLCLLEPEFAAARPLGLAHRRLRRRADADRHHRAARRDRCRALSS